MLRKKILYVKKEFLAQKRKILVGIYQQMGREIK